MNGVNAALTLSAAPSPAGSLKFYRNGMLLREGIGYTASGASLQCCLDPYRSRAMYSRLGIASNAPRHQPFNSTRTKRLEDWLTRLTLTFTLLAAPLPASSLQLSRNGILLKAGLDYVLSVNVITFTSAAIPQIGDVLQASYRR